MIKIEETEVGFAISFPFELKDEFRAAFKSAKWNSTSKKWEVGKRSGAKLKEWADTVLAKLPSEAELADWDERKMLQAEIDKIEREAQALADAIRQESKRFDSAIVLKDQLHRAVGLVAKRQAEFQEAKRHADVAESEANTMTADLLSRLSDVVDIARCRALAQSLARTINKVDRQSRKIFDEAQAELQEARRKLKSVGLGCEGLTEAATANFNRPDRDNPARLTEKQWLNIYEIEQD